MNYSMKKILAAALMFMGAATLAAQERVVDFYFLDPSSVTLSPDDLTTLNAKGKITEQISGARVNYLTKMSKMTLSADGVTIVAYSNGGTQPRFFWQGGNTNDTDDLYLCDFRTYKDNIITVTAPEGSTITKIVMYPKVTSQGKSTCCDMIIVDAGCGGKQYITGGRNEWVADENSDGLTKVTYNVNNPDTDKTTNTQSVYRMYVTLKGTASITDIAADSEDGPVEYFDLTGRQVKADSLTPGLYIRRQGQKSEKMLVKPGLNQ